MPFRKRELAEEAVLVERPKVKATGMEVRVTSTARGLLVEGQCWAHLPSGARQQGARVRDTYAMSRVLSNQELLAFVSWWSTERVSMLPDRPTVSVGLPVLPGATAAEQPGSLPGEGKGRGAQPDAGSRRRPRAGSTARLAESGRKADPIKGEPVYDQSAAPSRETGTAP